MHILVLYAAIACFFVLIWPRLEFNLKNWLLFMAGAPIGFISVVVIGKVLTELPAGFYVFAPLFVSTILIHTKGERADQNSAVHGRSIFYRYPLTILAGLVGANILGFGASSIAESIYTGVGFFSLESLRLPILMSYVAIPVSVLSAIIISCMCKTFTVQHAAIITAVCGAIGVLFMLGNLSLGIPIMAYCIVTPAVLSIVILLRMNQVEIN
ncbi:MAG: hypothetical protein ACRBHB_05840 [Arenicella sp.]